MTPDGAFDRRLTTWLEEDAAPHAPDGFDDVVATSVDQKRQLPSWATPERWISMESRARLGGLPRAAILILTVSFLVAALAASLALAGNLTNADDGGDPTAGLTYFTREGIVYKHPTDGTGEPVRLTDEDEFASFPNWSPDGTRFSYETGPVDWDGPRTLLVRDADGSNPVVISEPFEADPVPSYHAWSPDGSRVLFAAIGPDGVGTEGLCGSGGGTFCGSRIWSATADGSELARVIGDPALDARAPLWTPDGEGIIFTGSAGRGANFGIYRMDADGANVERIGDLAGSAYAFDRHAISPDGATLVVSSGHGRYDLYLVDLATGEDVLIASEEAADAISPFWSPDGSLIAYTSRERAFDGDDKAMLYEVASEEVIPLDMSLVVMGWSPDSRSIAGHHNDGIRIVDVTDPTAPVATEVESIPGAVQPNWQPDS